MNRTQDAFARCLGVARRFSAVPRAATPIATTSRAATSRSAVVCFAALLFAPLLTATLLSATASATVIYDEDANGDMPGGPDTFILLNLVQGENIIKGKVGQDGENPADPEDHFRFVLPDDFVIPEWKLEWEPLPPLPPPAPPDALIWSTELEWNPIDPDPGGWDVVLYVNHDSPGSKDLKNTPPDVGTPPPEWGGGGWGMRMKADIDPEYTVTIVIAPVPEPGTFALALLGLLSLGATAWCRRSRR